MTHEITPIEPTHDEIRRALERAVAPWRATHSGWQLIRDVDAIIGRLARI